MFYGWWIVILASFATAFGGATIWYGFTAFFSPLVNEFGWSYTAISFAASLRGVETGLLDLPFGFLVDRFGGRRVVFVGSMLAGIGFLMLSRVNSLTTFYISFIIIFCGATGFGLVVFAAIINRWFSKRAGLALGIISAGFGVGGIAVPGIVYLLDTFSLRIVFVIIGMATLIAGVFITYFLHSRPEDMGYRPDGVPPNGREYDSERASQHTTKLVSPARHYTVKEVIHSPPFWIILYVSTITVFTVQMVMTHVMPYLEHIGYSRYTASIVAMMIPVMSIFGRVGMGWVSDFINRRVMLILVTVGQVVGILLFFYARLSFFLPLFAILFGVSYGGLIILRLQVLRDYYGITYIGSIIGLSFGLSTIGGMLGPLLAGWLFDTTSNYSLAWVISGLLLLSSLPLILILKNPPPTVKIRSQISTKLPR
ncbi:MFS transporter [Chloroflexota bacterium]